MVQSVERLILSKEYDQKKETKEKRMGTAFCFNFLIISYNLHISSKVRLVFTVKMKQDKNKGVCELILAKQLARWWLKLYGRNKACLSKHNV